MRGRLILGVSLCAALTASACANTRRPAIDDDSADDDAVAALLLRCKVGELEEDLQHDGLPEVGADGKDRCCTGAEVAGYDCRWSIDEVELDEGAEELLVPGQDTTGADTSEAVRAALEGNLHERARLATISVVRKTGDGSAPARSEVRHLLLDTRPRFESDVEAP